MAKKGKLIREYFALRYEFAKIHNSETMFREEPTEDDIRTYSKNFKVIDLLDKIAAVATQLELIKKRLGRQK